MVSRAGQSSVSQRIKTKKKTKKIFWLYLTDPFDSDVVLVELELIDVHQSSPRKLEVGAVVVGARRKKTKIILVRGHPKKTSVFVRGGGSQIPMLQGIRM